jgi:hypothetical protein
MSVASAEPRDTRNSVANKVELLDRPVHDWYRFVLSFPPHLVRDYVDSFGLDGESLVLDPFCGTGTTVVECKKLGIPSVGIEAHPMSQFAASVKTTWAVDPDELLGNAIMVAEDAQARLAEPRKRLRRLPLESSKLLLANSISPRPLHKTLVLLDALRDRGEPDLAAHHRLALAKAVVSSASNLHFGPEVGVGPPKKDADVIEPWLDAVRAMTDDLRGLPAGPDARVYHVDSREPLTDLQQGSVDAVITSPPYPNEKDYTRTTRLESVLLGFVTTKEELRALKKGLVRSNTRGVYRGDADDEWIKEHPEIARIADAIEARRIELGKTSGFERMYPRVTKLYFGGMARHLANLRPALRPGARLAYVVGDQASYLRVMIRTGELLSKIAVALGYELEGIDLFRTRRATATRAELREEVVLLRWPG